MEVRFSDKATEHYLWLREQRPKLFKKAGDLIDDIMRDPYRGLGRPEALKHDYAGWWSRRINDEHRLVYRIEGDTLHIMQCRFHYDD